MHARVRPKSWGAPSYSEISCHANAFSILLGKSMSGFGGRGQGRGFLAIGGERGPIHSVCSMILA